MGEMSSEPMGKILRPIKLAFVTRQILFALISISENILEIDLIQRQFYINISSDIGASLVGLSPPDYRRQPENPFPVGFTDYRKLKVSAKLQGSKKGHNINN